MLRFLRHLRAATRRRALDADLREEITQHVEWKAQAYMNDGVPQAEARRQAAIDVGNARRLREEAAEMWGFPALDTVVQDVSFGVRLLRRTPAFTAVAILSLAVGIGATAAVFSLADALLFRKLAVTDPDSLVVFKWTSGPVYPFSSLSGYDDEANGGLTSTSFSRAAFDAFRRQAARDVDVFGFDDLYRVNMSIDGRADTGTAHEVSGNYFTVLGVNAAAGRTLIADDDRSSASPTAVVSDAFAERRFGGASNAIGHALAVNAVPFTIVGVLPASFHGTGQAGTNPDVYLPLAHHPLVAPTDTISDPNYWWVLIMARMKPGVSPEDARASLDVMLKRTVAAAKPNLASKDFPRLQLLPGARGQVEDRLQMQGTVATMAAVTIIVLLVACANVANLLLARGRARVRELAVRAAIGAPRRRLIRQLFTEAVMLAAAGTALGIVLAQGIAAALLPALTQDQPLLTSIAVDWRLVLFAAALAGGSAILFGLLPALRSTDVHLAAGLEETRRGLTATRNRRRLSGALVAIQIALSLLLVTAAGLLIRSVRNLQQVDLGFDARNLLLFQLDPSSDGYAPAHAQQLYSTVLDRLRAMPGVTGASLSSHRLISNSSSMTSAMRLEEAPPKPGSADARRFSRDHGMLELIVDEDFFHTMGIRIDRGRSFGAADAGGDRAAVINRALARQLFGTEDVVGRQFRTGTQDDSQPYRIVGVCEDARYTSLRRPMSPTAYLFYRQPGNERIAATFEARTAGPPIALATAVRDLVRSLDATLPVANVGTQTEQIERSVQTERLFARLATLLGLTAVALSLIGLYGLLAYAVLQRTPEIGVRMALGAARRAVGWMVLRESLALVALGVLAGVPAALAGTKILESLLFELPPRDPLTISGAAALMLALAAVAAYLPARRASRVDPVVALRSE